MSPARNARKLKSIVLIVAVVAIIMVAGYLVLFVPGFTPGFSPIASSHRAHAAASTITPPTDSAPPAPELTPAAYNTPVLGVVQTGTAPTTPVSKIQYGCDPNYDQILLIDSAYSTSTDGTVTAYLSTDGNGHDRVDFAGTAANRLGDLVSIVTVPDFSDPQSTSVSHAAALTDSMRLTGIQLTPKRFGSGYTVSVCVKK